MSFLTPPPSQPQRGVRATFASLVDGFISWLCNTFYPQLVALVSSLNALAAGGAYAIPYIVDLSSTADADPTNGLLRFNVATQNAATTIYLDLLGSDGIDYTSILDTFDASTNPTKGSIRIVKMGDPTKFLTFNVTARTTATGYRKLTLVNTGGSSASPFGVGDGVMLHFQRTGDMGPTGTLARRVSSGVNVTAPTPNVVNTDMYVITGLAGACTLGVPTGTPIDGQSLMFRIKDNGTAQTLAFNAIYRAPTELAFPAVTVVGKWTYLGFVYNANDSKWDLVAAISNM